MLAARSKPLRLPAEIDTLRALAAYIDDFAAQTELPPADSHAFLLATEELLANTLNHSRPPATHIEFQLSADQHFASAIYSDDGGAFDPTQLPEVDTTLPLDKRPIGGLGIHLIRRTMSAFHYQRRDGQNIITFGRPFTRQQPG